MQDRVFPSGKPGAAAAPPGPKFNGAYYGQSSAPPDAYRRRPRSKVAICCCWLLSALVTIIILLGIASLIIYLVLRPRIPKYSVEDVRIQKLNLTAESGTLQTQRSQFRYAALVDSDISFTLRADNRNKKIGIKYESISTRLFYEGNALGTGVIPAFYQGKRNVTVVNSVIRGSRIPLSQNTAGSLQSSINQNLIQLTSETRVRAKLKIGSYNSPPIRVRVRCYLRVTDPSAQGGGRLLSKTCRAKRLR